MAIKLFSISTAAIFLTCFYLYTAVKNLHGLMYPLSNVNISLYPLSQHVPPYWSKNRNAKLELKVYLSTHSTFTLDFVYNEFDLDNDSSKDTFLLWKETFMSSTTSLAKSVILTNNNETASSIQLASQWLDRTENKVAGNVLDVISQDGDMGSTSILLTLYASVRNLFSKSSTVQDGEQHLSDSTASTSPKTEKTILSIPRESPVWKNVVSNSTLHIHVLLTRHHHHQTTTTTTIEKTITALQRAYTSHNALLGHANVTKHDVPHHISKPTRYLYRDLLFFFQKPWDMSLWKPTEHQHYLNSLKMKRDKTVYPYWKPQVAIQLVSDDAIYPMSHVGRSGMEVISTNKYESGHAYLPGLYVDEIGLTSEMYIPLNDTIRCLPLYISFDTNSGDNKNGVTNGLSPARWRLLSYLSQVLENQKAMGFDESDIDDIRRLIADTNVTLLLITVLASTLHLLFEFLTLKSDVEFWKGNTDLTGLSVRALFMDFGSQVIILLYLIEKGSSLLMIVPTTLGCLIALWKCQRGAGLRFIKLLGTEKKVPSPWNRFFRLFGYELQATRLQSAVAKRREKDSQSMGLDDKKDLAVLTEEMDQLASRTLGSYLLLPLVLTYTVVTLVREEHSGWYSWLITSASSAVYALGFVLMTPQLFLNYKLKSVAHLPWRVLGYRFLNTFIDDLFAFIIRMPTMARISCFRDDVIFVIYLYQRYLYPVDKSRPTEGGGMDALSAVASTATITESRETHNDKKKKQQ